MGCAARPLCLVTRFGPLGYLDCSALHRIGHGTRESHRNIWAALCAQCGISVMHWVLSCPVWGADLRMSSRLICPCGIGHDSEMAALHVFKALAVLPFKK